MTADRARAIAVRGVAGLLMGFALSNIGFADFGEVHAMFTFTDLRLFLSFAGAVALGVAGFALFGWARRATNRPLHKGLVPGSLLFGAGWAVCGACPSIVLVQLGEGQLAALVTAVGVALGSFVYPRLHARWFRWDRGGCDLEA